MDGGFGGLESCRFEIKSDRFGMPLLLGEQVSEVDLGSATARIGSESTPIMSFRLSYFPATGSDQSKIDVALSELGLEPERLSD